MNFYSSMVHETFRLMVYGHAMIRLLMTGIAGLALGSSLMAGAPLRWDRDQSRVDIDVKATVGSFVGELNDWTANVEVDPATMRVEQAEFGFKFLDVTTGEEKRDKHMHKWQQTDKFPDGRFEMTSLVPGESGDFQATGKLTLHGQVQELTFPVSILTEDQKVMIAGEAELDTSRLDCRLFGCF